MRAFLDSNVIVYANDGRDTERQGMALKRIDEHMRSGTGVISIQVLQEYANVALGKLRQAPDVVLRQLHLLEAFEVVEPVPQTVRRAVEIRQAYGISFWDAGIVATAEQASCDVILSEDLNAGQFYAGIPVRNPFVDEEDAKHEC
jgi:predicted nucleic acid-binding protein